MQDKILLFGNDPTLKEALERLQVYNIRYQMLPLDYPPEKLTYEMPYEGVLYPLTTVTEDHLETIAHLRQAVGDRPMVIVVPTDIASSQLNVCYQYGAQACVFHPCTADDLIEAFRPLLRGKKKSLPSSVLHLVPSIFNPQVCVWGDEQVDLGIRMLGVLALSHRGKRIEVPAGLRQRSLLAYLLYHGTEGRIHRDRVIRVFWPDHDAVSARNCLHVSVNHLRRHLAQTFGPQEVICFKEDSYFLHPALKVWRDVDIFRQHFHQAQALDNTGQSAGAAEAYMRCTKLGIDFLECLYDERWTTWVRDDFSDKFIKAHFYLADALMAEQQSEAALFLLRQVLTKDDCLEPVHERIIRCYLALQQPEKAVRHYQECARTLWDKLKVAPSERLKRLVYPPAVVNDSAPVSTPPRSRALGG